MATIAIQIGNSDDKLTQKEWACFVLEVRSLVETMGNHIHFWGASVNYEPWQNLCCVCEVQATRKPMFLDTLKSIRERWKQDSVAVLTGETQFI
jgi:hypothetical protein